MSYFFTLLAASATFGGEKATPQQTLTKLLVAPDGRAFVTEAGTPFVPFGVTYFRPGTGWAPQVWKQFDAEATRKDFAKLRELGGNCVRVFLSFGSFYPEPGQLKADGLVKFDQFLALAEAAGLYVHPTGPDHWEGLPDWARGDRMADEKVLVALEQFWKLFAARYRGRNVIFAYDLLNEPEVGWDTPAMRQKWPAWLLKKYGDAAKLGAAWGTPMNRAQMESAAVPAKDAPPSKALLDYQLFREDIADEWTRRQVAAIKSVDPKALVTAGLIQWSVPVSLAGSFHYSAFRPGRQAALLDFMTVHFYPLANGFYDYRGEESEQRNLACLECVVREVARCGKPTMVGEFGWYGGGKLALGAGRYPAATEEQQARWCRGAVESTAGWASGWLNWGFHDHPGAGDVTELTGLLSADGNVKAWGRAFQELSASFRQHPSPVARSVSRPVLDWDLNIIDTKARDAFRESYFQAFKASEKNEHPTSNFKP
jgi:hypothetical protein